MMWRVVDDKSLALAIGIITISSMSLIITIQIGDN